MKENAHRTAVSCRKLSPENASLRTTDRKNNHGDWIAQYTFETTHAIDIPNIYTQVCLKMVDLT
jgi:hypothetical protein